MRLSITCLKLPRLFDCRPKLRRSRAFWGTRTKLPPPFRGFTLLRAVCQALSAFGATKQIQAVRLGDWGLLMNAKRSALQIECLRRFHGRPQNKTNPRVGELGAIPTDWKSENWCPISVMRIPILAKSSDHKNKKGQTSRIRHNHERMSRFLLVRR